MNLTYLLCLSWAVTVSAQSLTSILANSSTLSTLTDLLSAIPDVAQTLSTAQNITILAPSNTAFVDLLARNPRSAELMRNPRALAGVLQYHVLRGKLRSVDFQAVPQFPATFLSEPFSNVTGGQRAGLVLVNGTASITSGYKQLARVISADIEFDGNNIVHIIDTVLTVPASPAQTAINIGLTSLAGALTRVGLVEAINSFRDITIFAPSNSGFGAIGSALQTISPLDLGNILGYHVVPRVQFSPALLAADQMTLPTLQGQDITIRRDGSQLFVNSAKVLTADILTSNGVVHVLDNVLNPSNTTATPNPTAVTQDPAFAGITPVADTPFTTGLAPTTTFVPAPIPISEGSIGVVSSLRLWYFMFVLVSLAFVL